MYFFENNKKIAIFIVLIMFLSVFAGFGGAFVFLNSFEKDQTSSEDSNIPAETQGLNMDASRGVLNRVFGGNENLSIPEIYNLVSDSVVEITTETMEIGGFMGQYISSGAGSGVIYSEDGYIITNNHVINNASKITVILKNGAKYDAKIIGQDVKTDLAVIKIDEKGLQPTFFGDSNQIIVGELAVAVGNPLGELGGTITEGIISALDREIIIDNETMTLLQTTAAINPGNSGGGLFNSKGELVGIVNAKTSGSNIEGLGFAIPSNIVKEVTKQLLEFGYVKGRPALGVSIFEVTDARTAILYRLPTVGLYISAASEGNQLVVGDRIISFEGKEISKLADLKKLIDSHQVGDTVTVQVEREGSVKKLQIKLIELS